MWLGQVKEAGYLCIDRPIASAQGSRPCSHAAAYAKLGVRVVSVLQPGVAMAENAGIARETAASKVPQVTLVFWLMKITATTLGETGGDMVSMSMNLGYVVATLIYGVLFLILVTAQIKARRFHPALYWATIIATTSLGTTIADYADRSLGIGYTGGSALLLALLLVSLFVWHRAMGTVAVDTVSTPRSEAFYWVTIMFSQTLGTALGDWFADSAGFGYLGSAIVFGSLLALLAAGYFWTRISRTALFWAAFVLTRPLGAVLGDFFDKPHDHGGLAMSRYTASAVLLGFIILCLLVFPQRQARRQH
jgi:uncharacterized membrane-anchored protein